MKGMHNIDLSTRRIHINGGESDRANIGERYASYISWSVNYELRFLILQGNLYRDSEKSFFRRGIHSRLVRTNP